MCFWPSNLVLKVETQDSFAIHIILEKKLCPKKLLKNINEKSKDWKWNYFLDVVCNV
jgi:hypothetical protein